MSRIRFTPLARLVIGLGLLLVPEINALAQTQDTLTYTPTAPNVEQEVTFTVTFFNQTGTEWVAWDFGDGTTLPSQSRNFSVKHTYLRTGTFSVRATRTYDSTEAEANPIRALAVTTITITEKRYVTHDPASPSPGQQVRFTGVNFLATSTLWNYGDGTNRTDSSSQSFHTYAQSGTYQVTARDLAGKSAYVFNDTVIVAAKSITYAPSSPRANDNVTFTAHNFGPVKWDYGDGTVINTTSSTVVHAYIGQGVYQVKAYDAAGVKNNSPTATVSVTVSPPPLQRSISYSPAQPRAKEAVTFTAHNFTSSTLIRWEFGDGKTEDDTSPPTTTHTYDQNGVYQVRAYDGSSWTDYAELTITILPPAVPPSITYSPSQPYAGESVTFTANNFSSSSVIRWDYGDGKIETLNPPTAAHVYELPGTYRVNAYDGGGAAVTASTTVSVIYKSQPRISFSPAQPYLYWTVTFTANNFASKTLIRWDFGDNNVENDSTPPTITHPYKRSGVFLVRAYDGGGSTVTASVQVTVLEPSAPTITFYPSPSFANEPITFTARDFRSTSLIRWDFGDGIVEDDASPPSIAHVYPSPGVYQVRAYDGGGATVTAATTVTVLWRTQPTITAAPAQPYAQEVVTFTARDFSSRALIRWDFGDGAVENGTSPPSITHAYAGPGIYQITAYDGGGSQATASISLTVHPQPSLYFVPLQPRVGESVTFRAVDFLSPSIKWDLGDGVEIPRGQATVTHSFQTAGSYRVVAWDSRDGVESPFSVTVPVYPNEGPLAPFSISYILLRFEDGTPYRTVPLNAPRHRAFADIKFEGSGILSLQWLIDGQPFGMISKSLTFAGQTTIDSGEVPGLPTMLPGLHEVSLRFLQPSIDFDMPVIRYYVVAGESEPEPVRTDIGAIYDLEGRELPAAPTAIEVPVGVPFLLTGEVKNESRDLIETPLLSVYLDDEIIDQKRLPALRPGTAWKFLTSVITAAESSRRLYLGLYDIGPTPARLIFLREIQIIPAKKK